MKKLMVALMAVLFLGSTTLVMAQTPVPAAAPAAKSHKSKKHMKKMKKTAASAPAASTTPVAK